MRVNRVQLALALGAAGAAIAPCTLALVTSMFPDQRQRGKAVAVWASCQFAGCALGPVLAGFLLQYFWWGSVFLVAVPAMALLPLAGPVLLPEFRGRQPGRLDLSSAALSLAAVFLTVYGVKQLAVAGVTAGPAALAAGIVVGVGLLFVRRQLRLLRSRPQAGVLVALLFAGGVAAGTMAALALARRMKQATQITARSGLAPRLRPPLTRDGGGGAYGRMARGPPSPSRDVPRLRSGLGDVTAAFAPCRAGIYAFGWVGQSATKRQPFWFQRGKRCTSP
jgi:MFS family permease